MFRRNDMAKRRSRVDIVVAILQIADKGAKKTQIVYGANLNFKFLNGYLDKLEKAGLIARDYENNGIIKTTEKGEKYLQHYVVFKDFGII